MSQVSYEVSSILNARMAELADALDSGSSDRKVVGVQLPLRALQRSRFPFRLEAERDFDRDVVGIGQILFRALSS